MPSSPRRDRRLALTLGAAVLAQGLGLVLLDRPPAPAAAQWLLCAAALALLFQQAWRHRWHLNHRVDMLLIMLAVGGLGMLAGTWIDEQVAARATGNPRPEPPAAGPAAGGDMTIHPPAGHAAHISHAAHRLPSPHGGHQHSGHQHGGLSYGSLRDAAFSWMTALMLLGAIPPAVAFTRCAALARADRRRWFSTHIAGNAGMVVGMLLLGALLAPSLARMFGSARAAGHVAMLIGMAAGMLGAQLAAELLLGLKPWRRATGLVSANGTP